MGHPRVNSIHLSEVTPEEIIKILQSRKYGAAGYDGLSSSLLKMVASLIVNPLAYICNLSLKQGVFPAELKIANVLRMYKSHDPLCFCNDPRAAGPPDRVVTDLILVMEKSEECSGCRRYLYRVPQSREHKRLQIWI